MAFDAAPAVKALQSWYNPDLYGLYHWDDPDLPFWIKPLAPVATALQQGDIVEQYQETERWWNSANALGALIDYMATSGDKSYLNVVDNTFTKAQNAYTITGGKVLPPEIDKLQYAHFLNNYYDDEGWWALTWIKAFELTGNHKYLTMAASIAEDMTSGWDNTNDGLYWASDHKGPGGQTPYKNAIANELFMAVTARLYLRTQAVTWKNWAQRECDWFITQGLIWGTRPDQDLTKQPKFLINDALNAAGNNDGTEKLWTYNHGVILRALCDLSIIFGDQLAMNPLTLAEEIADAAITKFAPNGILTEPACDPNCSIDGCQFKGVFIRNLAVLYVHNHKPAYRTFITNNAMAVVANSNASSQCGDSWSSQPGTVDFVRQTAGIDAINAANRVLIADMPISLKSTLAQAGIMSSTGVRHAIAWLTPSVRAWLTAWTT